MSAALPRLLPGAWVVLALALVAQGAQVRAAGAAREAGEASDADQAMGRRLQEALRAQNGAIHRCYAESLTRDPQAAGELLVRLVMGQGGAVARAEVLKDQSVAPGLSACLVASMSGWRLPQLKAAAGDQVVFPLVFKPDEQGDPSTDGAGADAVAPLVIPARLARSAHGGAARVYIDAHSHPGSRGSLTLLTLRAGPAKSLSPPLPERHGSAEVLYVVSGRGRLRAGGRTLALEPGDGVLIGPGAVRTVVAGDATGQDQKDKQDKHDRQDLVLLQVFAPAGPEQEHLHGGPRPVPDSAYKDAEQTAERVSGTETRALSLPGCSVKILVDAALAPGLSPGDVPSLEELTCEPGAEIPLHQHQTSDELIYILSGRGAMTAGDRSGLMVGPGDAVRVPMFLHHALRVTERMVAVQSYVPAGPEGRFRGADAPRPSTTPKTTPNTKPKTTPKTTIDQTQDVPGQGAP